ncbi:hypothetical protein ACIGBL_33730 [Streptomyces sp. NPDC085614]|uniref:hypothetical protein n=1 Tax=Streptomyces sp. NPDC085614 TaxID=3365733 RepID=UPI0037D80AA6
MKSQVFAALAAAGVLVAAAVSPASAGTVGTAEINPIAYKVEVTFTSLSLDQIDDCSVGTCTAEVYGTLMAGVSNGGNAGLPQKKYLNFGGWGFHGVDTWADADGNDKRIFRSGDKHYFANTTMCASSSWDYCNGGYERQNSKVVLTVTPGSSITTLIQIKDYDLDSADDILCNVLEATPHLSEAQLKNLDKVVDTGSHFNGDASCGTRYRMKTVGVVWPTL